MDDTIRVVVKGFYDVYLLVGGLYFGSFDLRLACFFEFAFESIYEFV